MSHLGDSLRTYWCGPSGHDFTVARRRSDGTMSTVLCLACQKRQASSICLFCDAEDGTRMTVVSPEGGRVVGMGHYSFIARSVRAREQLSSVV